MLKKSVSILIILLFLMAGMFWVMYDLNNRQGKANNELENLIAQVDSLKDLRQVPFNYAELITQFKQYVVSINAYSDNDSLPAKEYEFGDFFTDDQPPKTENITRKQGSGLLIQASNQVKVLTAAHVVNKSLRIEIAIGDSLFEADIEWLNTGNDLAILRAYKLQSDLTGARINNSVLKEGDRVLALGKPLSNDLYYTDAVMSIINGELILDKKLPAGMSGAPIFNLEGQPIGTITRSTLKKTAEDFSTAALFYQIPDSLLNN